MAEIDRIVRGLVESDAPLERSALLGPARDIAREVAPLADDDVIVSAVDAIVGLGPLEDLIADENVTDVLVNRHDEVWVERAGELVRTDVAFVDDAAVVAMVRRLIAPLGLRIDMAQPAVDARLPDGSRLHAIIPPAAVDGPVVAIRRFHAGITSLDGLVAAGGTDAAGAAHLADLVASRANILIAGPTGAGKTTILNILCRSTAPGERIVTVEDAAELTPLGHSVRLEARSANVDGAGGTTLRELVRHALRLRPDRIIVGEVRGAEALDMVQALTTGHRGSMSTIHANSSAEALSRLGTLAAMAPERVPHEPLAILVRSAIDAIVVVDRVGGRRRITSIDFAGDEHEAPA